MAAIQQLLRRWGFVKLGRYGLVLTAEGRVLSMRPAVLDDGSGGRIVGWEADDLAMTELSRWEPRPASGRAVASRDAMPQAAAPAPPVRPPCQVEAPDRAEIAQSRSVPAQPQHAVAVAPAPTVDEDDWEWTIALARARAAAEEVVAAPSPPPPDLATRDTAPALPVAPAPRPPSRTRPMAVVAMKDPAVSGEWPKTATIGSIDYEDAARVETRPITRPVPRPVPPSLPRSMPASLPKSASLSMPAMPRGAPAPAQPLPTAAAPITVIPVPTLPTVQGTVRAGRIEPVVRPAAVRVPPRRFPKGTGPVDSRAEPRAAELSDDTDPTVLIGDRTQPGIALPPAARAVSLPSLRRRGAPR
ncbi:MAG TPA: hypothetical protein VFT22_45305 [Kofleriaceae bacterium]|nr:hypothetical protein [Kofleriaceae bacterium]